MNQFINCTILSVQPTVNIINFSTTLFFASIIGIIYTLIIWAKQKRPADKEFIITILAVDGLIMSLYEVVGVTMVVLLNYGIIAHPFFEYDLAEFSGVTVIAAFIIFMICLEDVRKKWRAKKSKR
jgi:hypothetical protein